VLYGAIGGILPPDGMRLDLARNLPAVAHATLAAETVTRALVTKTHGTFAILDRTMLSLRRRTA
jgi:hypothetical protein